MSRVLLLLDDSENRRLLSEYLSGYYQVALPNSQTSDEPFDICILDEPALARLSQEIQTKKEAESPVFLPVLLVSQGNIRDTVQYLGHTIDEVITSPVNPVELKARLSALLWTRHLSLQLKSGQEIITRTSKAIESASDAISIADMHGTALYHNQAFLDLFGFTVNEINVTGIPHALFVDPEIAENIFRTIQQGQTWSGEVQLMTKGGKIVPTLLRADSIENELGKYTGLISVYTDITERKQVETTQREQRVMAEALRDTAAALTSTLDLDEVLERILANVGQVVPHDAANIMLVEDNMVRIVRGRGYANLDLEEKDLTTSRLNIGDIDILTWMIETGKPVAISDTDTMDARGSINTLQTSLLCSYAGAPIYLKSDVIGFLNLGSVTPGFFDPIHAERLQAFAEQAAIGIQNAQLHEKAQTLAALEERQRLARDLHDAVSQTLFSASVIAESLPRLWDRDPEKVRPRLTQLHRLTRGALAEMRTLLMELRPTALLEASFDDLLRQLTEAVMGRMRIALTLEMEALNTPLPADVKVALYYIAQEALHNVVKHARATEVSVHLDSQQNGLRLSIRDNGRGFDAKQVPSTSLGLRILHERAQNIGAILKIAGEVGHGTEIVIDWSNETEGRHP